MHIKRVNREQDGVGVECIPHASVFGVSVHPRNLSHPALPSFYLLQIVCPPFLPSKVNFEQAQSVLVKLSTPPRRRETVIEWLENLPCNQPHCWQRTIQEDTVS